MRSDLRKDIGIIHSKQFFGTCTYMADPIFMTMPFMDSIGATQTRNYVHVDPKFSIYFQGH